MYKYKALKNSDLRRESIWREGLLNGELVYAMRQSKTELMTLPSVSKGYCVGAAVQWLLERRSGNDFEFDKRRKIFHNPNPSINMLNFQILHDQTNDQLHTNDLGASSFFRQKDEVVFQAAGFHVLDFRRIDPPLLAEKVVGTLHTEPGLYYLNLIGSTEGHAVAIETSRSETKDIHLGKEAGGHRYFDSWYGHFRLKSKIRFIEWLKFLLSESKYSEKFLGGNIYLLR